MILYLLQNKAFKERYIDTQCLVAGSLFHPDRANSLLDKQQAQLDDEYLIHAKHWDIAHKYRNEFHYSINLHKQMTLAFRESAYRNLRTNFQLDTAHFLSITASTPATLTFNGLDIPYLPYDGRYFDNRPLTVTAPPLHRQQDFPTLAGSTQERSSQNPNGQRDNANHLRLHPYRSRIHVGRNCQARWSVPERTQCFQQYLRRRSLQDRRLGRTIQQQPGAHRFIWLLLVKHPYQPDPFPLNRWPRRQRTPQWALCDLVQQGKPQRAQSRHFQTTQGRWTAILIQTGSIGHRPARFPDLPTSR